MKCERKELCRTHFSLSSLASAGVHSPFLAAVWQLAARALNRPRRTLLCAGLSHTGVALTYDLRRGRSVISCNFV